MMIITIFVLVFWFIKTYPKFYCFLIEILIFYHYYLDLYQLLKISNVVNIMIIKIIKVK